jgi:hypothetical protein
MDECKLRVFEKRVLDTIFETTRKEIKGGWGKCI